MVVNATNVKHVAHGQRLSITPPSISITSSTSKGSKRSKSTLQQSERMEKSRSSRRKRKNNEYDASYRLKRNDIRRSLRFPNKEVFRKREELSQ
ncbi:hypothetical protein KIN20_009800 [Parelaphostrongylus tenuis]|uniref:Uncharacterized protein n=1 Tax=Parelaphostrongylus tenuis TaxID=148309 RepID=A0AAD5MBM0_PARTN|nr:hypothetical protein KIN20_009800 [Parelaphostrongylus tenuis]